MAKSKNPSPAEISAFEILSACDYWFWYIKSGRILKQTEFCLHSPEVLGASSGAIPPHIINFGTIVKILNNSKQPASDFKTNRLVLRENTEGEFPKNKLETLAKFAKLIGKRISIVKWWYSGIVCHERGKVVAVLHTDGKVEKVEGTPFYFEFGKLRVC